MGLGSMLMQGCESKIDVLIGKTLKSVKRIGENSDEDDEIILESVDGERWKLYHYQDFGSPILQAEEVFHDNANPPDVKLPEESDESFAWTFYKLATIKGSVTIRWYGSSNGYYSESAAFAKIENGD